MDSNHGAEMNECGGSDYPFTVTDGRLVVHFVYFVYVSSLCLSGIYVVMVSAQKCMGKWTQMLCD